MNEEDQKLFNDAKEALKIGSLEELAVMLGYAKSSANNWYGKGFSDKARYKLVEILEEHRKNNKLSGLTQKDIERYFAIAGTKQAVSEMQQNQKPLSSDDIDYLEKLIKEETTQDKINIKYLANTFGSMGEGGVSYEELPSVMSFDKEFLVNIIGLTEFKNIFIINALGDSMSPSIKDGSKLFINPFENENCIIVSGAVYVIYSPQLGYLVKRVARESFDGSVTLKSDNKDYKDLVITQEQLEGCRIIGRVVGNFDGRV